MARMRREVLHLGQHSFVSEENGVKTYEQRFAFLRREITERIPTLVVRAHGLNEEALLRYLSGFLNGCIDIDLINGFPDNETVPFEDSNKRLIPLQYGQLDCILKGIPGAEFRYREFLAHYHPGGLTGFCRERGL